MNDLSEHNKEKFREMKIDLRESRLRKVAKMIMKEKAGSLLDIGCGEGSFGSLFITAGFKVYGVDLTTEQINKARLKGIIASVHDISKGNLPFEDGMFDIIFAGEIIEHIVDTSFFLKEMYRILKPDGAIIITTPNLASFENRVRLFFGFYPIWVDYKLETGQGHVRAYTPRALKHHLVDSGFVVERHVGNWVPFIPQKFIDDLKVPLLALSGDCAPSFAMDIIIKARKPKQ